MFFDTLESRRLLSASTSVYGDVLHIRTSDATDLTVTEERGAIVVREAVAPGDYRSIAAFWATAINHVRITGSNDADVIKVNARSLQTAVVYGYGGRDYLRVDNHTRATLYGGDGPDILVGSENRDQLFGGAGDDSIIGNRGNDNINAGSGNDVAWGGDGNDRFFAAGGRNRYYGNGGNDTVDYSGAFSSVQAWMDGSRYGRNGLGGYDRINGDIEQLYGSRFSDYLVGNALDNFIHGGDGNDFLVGNAGDDTLNGNDGDDTAYGGDGNDFISGGNGNDQLFGNNHDDRIWGNDGNDFLHGGNGADSMWGNDGNDRFDAVDGRHKDRVYGGAGYDSARRDYDLFWWWEVGGDHVEGVENKS